MPLPSRLVVGRRLQFFGGDRPVPLPSNVLTALSGMPALAELELVGLDLMSSAPQQELAAAPQPAFARLTSLHMSHQGDSSLEATALYLWLQWALPGRRSSASCLSAAAGGTTSKVRAPCRSVCCTCEAFVCSAAPSTAAAVLRY